MLLDTDFLIALLRKNTHALQFLEDIIIETEDLWISHVNLWELFQGAYLSQKVTENLIDIEDLIGYFDIIDFSKASDKRFGKLIAELSQKGTPIGVMDTILASLALEHNKAIITRNTKHFETAGVLVRTW